jgi:AcrR family transcriptional regulator
VGGERTGRPRSESAHAAILQAARELIVEIGYAKLSMERVATRAGVGKQTVYRRWTSKAAMVADVVLDRFGPVDPAFPPYTEDIERDLRNWLHEQVRFLGSQENVALARALLAAAADNLEDADALYQQINRPHREELVQRLWAAVEKGQLRENADLDAVADVISGAISFPLLAGSAAVPSIERADGLLDVIMFGVRPEGGDQS